jgi:hypothetical protein
MILMLKNLFKRFLGYPLALQKQQCGAKIKFNDTVYFCTKNNGHLGSHKNYRGKIFFASGWN